MQRRTKKLVQREIEVTEEVCDLTGETLAHLEGRNQGEVVHPHFRLHLELVGQREDGTPFTIALGKDEAPRVNMASMVKLLGAKTLGELFPSFTFDPTGMGKINRRKATNGKPKGPEID